MDLFAFLLLVCAQIRPESLPTKITVHKLPFYSRYLVGVQCSRFYTVAPSSDYDTVVTQDVNQIRWFMDQIRTAPEAPAYSVNVLAKVFLEYPDRVDTLCCSRPGTFSKNGVVYLFSNPNPVYFLANLPITDFPGFLEKLPRD